MKLLILILQLVIFFLSVIIHEVAHGYMALVKGDYTAKEYGRLTINPLPHIDLFGTIILPIILLITRAGVIVGWAKPVPINTYNFSNPRKDLMWVGAAGPLSNIVIAIILSILYRIGFANYFIKYGIGINLLLAFFNLVPIPPLDGSRILQGFLSYDAYEKYMMIERFGFIIIFLLLYMGLFEYILLPLVSLFLKLLIGSYLIT